MFENKAVDPREEALTDVLHWIWSWRVQLQRLISSTKVQGQCSGAIERCRSYSCASYDEHALVVVGWNLARAMKKAGELFPSIRFTENKSEVLRLLRNLYEHWDSQREPFRNPKVPKERSAKDFATLFPTGRPWSITFAQDDWLLGGVIGVNSISAEIATIETEALELETQLLGH